MNNKQASRTADVQEDQERRRRIYLRLASIPLVALAVFCLLDLQERWQQLSWLLALSIAFFSVTHRGRRLFYGIENPEQRESPRSSNSDSRPKESSTAVETPLGKLYGRDCIALDEFSFDGSLAIIRGKVEGRLCSPPLTRGDIDFAVAFVHVVAIQVIPVDDWQGGASAFDEVFDSQWLEWLGGNYAATHRHFAVVTYEEVFELVATELEFEANPPVPPNS